VKISCCRPSCGRVTLAGVIYSFDSFELDTETFELREAGEAMPIQRKVFDVLRYLVEHRTRVVGKEELLEAVWPKEFVVDSAVHRVISHLRRALRQDGRDTPIETVHGRGYRFRADVQDCARQRVAVGPEAATVAAPALRAPASPDEPAVLAEPLEVEPFVGREDLLAELAQGLHDASRKSGRMYLLTGESGVGKTHVVEMFVREAQQKGAVLWKARCSDFEGVPAFWPWIQLLRICLKELPAGSPLEQRVQRLLAELVPEVGGPARVILSGPEAAGARFLLLDELSQFFIDMCSVDRQGRGGAAAQPTVHVLWLDDLTPEDADSFRVLHLLSAAIDAIPLVVVATMRTLSPAHGRALGVDAIPEAMHRIPLEGLTEHELFEYVSRTTPLANASLLASWLLQKTGGNPLFVREMLRYLAGSLGEQIVTLESLDELPLPAAVHEIVGRRLAALPPEVRQLLELAAVLGETFALPPLQRAAEIESASLLQILDDAVRLGLLRRELASRGYGFVHGVIRDALYQGLDSNDAAQLHLQVAQALEAHAVDGVDLSELAYHFYRSLPYGSPKQAQRYAVQAARAAGRATSYVEAARFMGWALEAQSFDREFDPHKRCRFLLSAGMSEHAAGNELAARSHVTDLVELAARYGYGDLLAVAAMILRPMSVAMRPQPDPLARRALEAALHYLPESHATLRSRVMSLLSWLPPYAHDRTKRLEMSSQARLLADPRDPRSEFDSLFARHLALSAPEDLHDARKLTTELLELCRTDPASISALEAHFFSYHTYMRCGELSSALRELESFGALSHEWRFPSSIWIYDRLCLQHSFYNADFDRTVSGLKELYERSERNELGFGSNFLHLFRSHLEREYGDRSELDWIPREDGAGFAVKTPAQHARSIREAAEAGRLAFARSELARMGRSGFRDLPRDGVFLATLAELSLAAIALDAREHAERLLDLLQPFSDQYALDEHAFSWGAVAYYVGQLAASAGQLGTAAEQLEHAMVLNARLGHRPQEVRTRLALGTVLLRHTDRRARDRGVGLLRGVHLASRELGLEATRRQIELALFKIGPLGDTA